MTELNEATDYTRKVARELWFAADIRDGLSLLARALATPALVEPEDPDDLLADKYAQENWPRGWKDHGRDCYSWGPIRAGIRLARENPL